MKKIVLFIILFSGKAYAADSDTCTGQSIIPEAKCANIVFPAIFCGNEEKCTGYIASFSSSRRNYLINIFTKSRKYVSKVRSLLIKYDVPQEFWVLMALESAFNPKAVSKAGAVGFWQFMDPVAKEYGLKIIKQQTTAVKKQFYKKNRHTVIKTKEVDERGHFLKSTIAAAKYLKDRARNLNNNWLLIAASYNWGIGNVWNAMQKTKLTNPSFWDIKKYVPEETRLYVMNFITLNVIFHNYEKFLSNSLVFYDEQPKPFDENIISSIAASF